MNNLCSGGPLYFATPLIGNFTTGATVPTYCNATTTTPATRYIDDISFLGMLNGNIYNLNTGFTTTPAPGGYQDWTGLATKQDRLKVVELIFHLKVILAAHRLG